MAKKSTTKKSPVKKATTKNLLTKRVPGLHGTLPEQCQHPPASKAAASACGWTTSSPTSTTTFTDPYGTAVGVINPSAKYKVVIEAHADEISWFVHYITKEGFHLRATQRR
jgi:hypothetical protein